MTRRRSVLIFAAGLAFMLGLTAPQKRAVASDRSTDDSAGRTNDEVQQHQKLDAAARQAIGAVTSEIRTRLKDDPQAVKLLDGLVQRAEQSGASNEVANAIKDQVLTDGKVDEAKVSKLIEKNRQDVRAQDDRSMDQLRKALRNPGNVTIDSLPWPLSLIWTKGIKRKDDTVPSNHQGQAHTDQHQQGN